MKLLRNVVVVAIDFDGTIRVYGPFKSTQAANWYVAKLEREELCDNASSYRIQEPV